LSLQTTTSSQLQLNLAGALINAQDPNDLNHLACIECMFEPETVEVTCSACSGKTSKKTLQIIKLPEYLFMPISKFTFQNWIPQKLDYPIDIPETLELTQQVPITNINSNINSNSKVQDHDDNETNHKDKNNANNTDSLDSVNNGQVFVNQEALEQLMAMGFSKSKSRKALEQTGNINAEIAMNDYLLLHLDDEYGENDDKNEGESGNTANDGSDNIVPSSDLVNTLMDAGFTKEQSVKALVATNNNIERAFDWILSHSSFPLSDEHGNGDNSGNGNGNDAIISHHDDLYPTSSTSHDLDQALLKKAKSYKYRLVGFTSHRGSSMQCGHYIAHRWDPDRGYWLMCNDEKIVAIKKKDDLFEHAKNGYIYLYKRE